MAPSSPLFFALGTGHHSWEPGELMRFDPREGREALYFTFSSSVRKRSICTLHALRFKD